MRFRVTAVTCEETTGPLISASVKIEDWLNAALGDGNFGEGVDQFTLVIISVDESAEENSRWANSHNKIGQVIHPFTGEKIRTISSAGLLSPSLISGQDPAAVLSCVTEGIVGRLASHPKRIPKGFDYDRCALAVSKSLAAFSR